MSSELRQRKGNEGAEGKGAELAKKGAGKEEDEEKEKEALLDHVSQMLTSLKRAPKPGTSHAAKKWKDLLQGDPYNMEYIFNLGKAYAEDEQWDRCVNVMLRGWKRVKEFSDQKTRLEFLLTLAQASLQQKMFRQALAIVNDAEEPEEESKALEVLRCQVYCANGDLQKGLKAFNMAIDGVDFESATMVWAGSSTYLKKCGAWEATRQAMESLAQTDEDRSRLSAIQKLADLKDAYLGAPADKGSNLKLYILAIVGILCLIMAGYFLYLLEAKSLEKLRLKK